MHTYSKYTTPSTGQALRGTVGMFTSFSRQPSLLAKKQKQADPTYGDLSPRGMYLWTANLKQTRKLRICSILLEGYNGDDKL